MSLKNLLLLSLALAFSPLVFAAPEYSHSEVADNIWVINAPAGNVVVARDAEGLVIVDGGRKENAEALLAYITESFGDAPIRALFNTHWHPDQTGLNELLGSRGVPIIAHENTKQWLAYDIWFEGQQLIHQAMPASALPTETIYKSGALPFASGEIEYGYLLQAHTDGDIYVRFPAQNVLVTGGAVSSDHWNNLDWWCGGWIGGLLDGFETLLALADDETAIVPVSGPVINKHALAAQHEDYKKVFARLVALLKTSQSPPESVAAKPVADLNTDWPDADAFVEPAFRSLFAHLRRNEKIGIMP